jgi:hypothetical protein
MDGEILFSDAGRFAALKDLVDADLKDRAQWYDRAVKNRTERFKRTNTVKPMYEGAPNLVDPIIDDLIRELKQSIVTTLWQAPHLAQFIGLDDIGVAQAENAEAAFDFHLRKACKTRSRISQCVDDELTFGYGLSKLVEVTGRGGLAVPEFWPVSPLSVVVPTSTLEIGQAERVCHMMRYTVAEFRRVATANGWDSAVMTLAIAKAAERRNAAASGDRGEARARYRDGSLNDSGGGVEVWEIFYETSDAGRRVCSLSPDVPDRPLDDRPWTWVALVGAESEPPVRPWPFVQFRNEDTIGFYNTRGLPEILEVDQKEASTYRTTRAIAIDFAGKPFLSGQRHSTPFRFRAGEQLDGREIIWAKTPGVDHIYQQDYSRNLAMKRVGSTQGAIASVAGADQRKTATEVNAMMAGANGMSTDAVDRFAEPWAEMFDMMWTFMARTARANGGKCGLIQAAGKVLPSVAWAADYCISAGVSGRSVNQIRTLTALTNMGQLAPIVENMTETLGPSAVRDFFLWIFNTLDTELARRVMASASKGGPPDKEGGVLS